MTDTTNADEKQMLVEACNQAVELLQRLDAVAARLEAHQLRSDKLAERVGAVKKARR